MQCCNDPVVIVGAARTPMGGSRATSRRSRQATSVAAAIKAAVERAGIRPRTSTK
jgi:acetyl-CoA C-acetyltransferase